MCHVRLDEMSSGQGAAEAEFAGQDTGSNDPSKTASVVAGIGGVGAFDSEQVQHRTLGFKNGAATNRAHLDRRHRYADLKIPVITITR